MNWTAETGCDLLTEDDSDEFLTLTDDDELLIPSQRNDPIRDISGHGVEVMAVMGGGGVDDQVNFSDSFDSETTVSIVEDEAVVEKTRFLSLIARLSKKDILFEEFDGIYSEGQDSQHQVIEELIELISKYLNERPTAEFVIWKGSILQKASLALRDHIDDFGRLKLKAAIIGLVRTIWNSIELNLHVVWERQLNLINEFCFDLELVSEVLNDAIHLLCELKAVFVEPLWKLEEREVSLLEKCSLFVDFARSLARKFKEMSKKQPVYRESLHPWIVELEEVTRLGDTYYATVSVNIQGLLNDLSVEDLKSAMTLESIAELGEKYEEF